MSVTLISKPTDGSINSIYRPIEYAAESNDTSGTLTLVRMSIRIYVGGSVVNNLNPLIQDPDLDQTGASGSKTRFTFDISGILQDYFSHDLQSLGFEAGATTANSMKTIGIFYGAIYKNTDNVLTESSTLNDSANTAYAINAVRQHLETQNFSDYTLASSAKKLLTPFAIDQKIKIKTSESYQLSGLYTDSSPDYKINVKTYNSSGTLIHTYEIAVGSVGARFDVGVGSSNFANLVSGDMDSGGSDLPIIDSSVATYDVKIYDDTTQISGNYKFEIDRKAHNYSTRITWKNRLGGFDAWTFDGASSRGQNQAKEFYTKNLATSFSATDRQRSILNVSAANVFSAWSGILTENYRTIFEELYSSPEVYLIENSQQIPIIISDSQVKTIDDDKNLFQLKINYQYAFENIVNV